MVLVILYKCTAPVPQFLLIIVISVSVTWDVLKDQCYSTTATHGSYNGHETFDWLSQITIRALEGQPPVSSCHLPDCRCIEHSSPCTTRATLQPTQHYSGQWPLWEAQPFLACTLQLSELWRQGQWQWRRWHQKVNSCHGARCEQCQKGISATLL